MAHGQPHRPKCPTISAPKLRPRQPHSSAIHIPLQRSLFKSYRAHPGPVLRTHGQAHCISQFTSLAATNHADSNSNTQPHLPARSPHAVTVTDPDPDTLPAAFFKALYLPHFSTDSHPNHRSTNSHSFHTAYSTTHCCAHYPDCFSDISPDVFAWKPHSFSITHTVPGAVCPAVCEADSSPQRSSHCSTDIYPTHNSTHSHSFHTPYSTTHCCAHHPDCFSHNRPYVFAGKPHSLSIPHTYHGAVCSAVCEADTSA